MASDITPFADARQLTDRIKAAVEDTWQLIREAYTSRTWEALGYASWDEYCSVEFGTSRLRLPREDRQDIVGSLREAGLSTRAIASATGLNQSTIVRDLAPTDANASVGEVKGVNGKSYTPTRPRPAPANTWYAGPEPAPLPTGQDRADREVAEAEQRALHPVPTPAPVDPHADGDARRDAELEAAMENTATRFRLNFSTARGHSKAVWQFDVGRIAEVYAAPDDRQDLLIWIREMRSWCDRVTEALDKTTTLRSVGGNR